MNYQTQPTPSVGLKEAAKLYFNKATDTKSRSRRSEYWMAVLFLFLVNFAGGFVFSILTALLGDVGAFIGAAAMVIWGLICLVASISLCIRRLHDTGKSGLWYLLVLVPFGSIVLLVFFCMDSTEDNQWGPNPKYVSAVERPSVNSVPPRMKALPQREDPFVSTQPVSRPASVRTEPVVPADRIRPGEAAVPATVIASNETSCVCSLYITSGPLAGKNVRIPEGRTVTLGRNNAKCDIALSSYNVVSGVHCRITVCKNYINIVDLNSTNGTFVNGTRLTPNQTVSARNGATIQLANASCTLQVRFN